MQELQRRAARSRLTGTWLGGGRVVERAYDAIVEGFDLVLLLVGDFGLRLDDTPELEHVVLDLLHVDNVLDNVVCARYLLDVCLQLAYILADNLKINYLALSGKLSMQRGRERD